jgi:hypothetical protein
LLIFAYPCMHKCDIGAMGLFWVAGYRSGIKLGNKKAL